jgi:DNA-binding MarR family transcriptional regulator
MHSSNTAAALRDAQARGYIFRSPDTVDRRRSWVILSGAGRKTLADARARRSDWLEQAIQREFTQDERDLLIRAGELLERLANVGDLK